MTGLWDVAFALALAMLMLLALDWRIQKAFQSHEVREEKLHLTSQLLAEGAAARALDNIRHLEDLRIETNAIRLDVTNLSELVRVHESRISDAEMKLLRASMLVPRRGDP